MLELSDWEFRTAKISMLRALMGKVHSRQEQMCNASREVEIPRRNEDKMLAIKNTLTEMKNALEELISRLYMAEERISELKDRSIETSKMENQREKRLKKPPDYPRTVGQL